MTEAEWEACADPTPMLERLRGKASDRKLRLWACACVRRFWHLLTDKRGRKAVQAAERYADGMLNLQALGIAAGQANWARQYAAYLGASALTAARFAADVDCVGDAVITLESASKAAREVRSLGNDGEAGVQAGLLRDLFGSLFRPAALDPSWLAWNDGAARKMAQAIYDDRAFHNLPLLADALEEAGCDDRDILGHCRGGGEHVRGCWVVDLLLGKS